MLACSCLAFLSGKRVVGVLLLAASQPGVTEPKMLQI